ncbi:MAG TPA: PQQ-binding-like beta-propeller repeat protein [Thermoanaerobaculia bacterium]|nr:PQQ-binding-like beta-propeller repeat protein [Thermoanaerobaculia bacterium]
MQSRRFSNVAIFALGLAVQLSCNQKSEAPAATTGAAPHAITTAAAPAPGEATFMCTLPSSAVVVGVRDRVLSFGPGGDELWAIKLPDGDTVASAPAAALNSSVYIRGIKAIYSISPDGKILWQAKDDDAASHVKGLVTLGDSTVAVTHGDDSLVSYSELGQPRWPFKLPDGDKIIAPPIVAPNSAIYLRGTSTMYAVDPHGLLTWEKELTDKAIATK